MEPENIESAWISCKAKYKVHQPILGKIFLVKPFGIFVDIGEENILGFIRVVDVSDEEEIYEPEKFKGGDFVKGVIIGFTDHNHQVLISLKRSSFGKKYGARV